MQLETQANILAEESLSISVFPPSYISCFFLSSHGGKETLLEDVSSELLYTDILV